MIERLISRPSIPPNLMGWVWVWQLAVRSSKLTMDVCGSRQTRHEAQFFSSSCHASRLDWAAPWSGLACEADGTPELFWIYGVPWLISLVWALLGLKTDGASPAAACDATAGLRRPGKSKSRRNSEAFSDPPRPCAASLKFTSRKGPYEDPGNGRRWLHRERSSRAIDCVG